MRPRLMSASFAMILALAAATALAQQDQSEPEPAGAPPSSTAQGMPAGAMGGAGGMPMMGMMRIMGRDGMGGMAMMAAAMSEHVEGRLAFLKIELKITDAQLPLRNNLAQAVRDNAKTMGSMMQNGMTGMKPAAALPDKLAIREKMMTAHLEALRKLKAVVEPLYTAFTDEH